MADPVHDHCRVVGCKCGGAARAAAARTADQTDLTPAEQAAAHELGNICWHTGPSTDPASLCGECDNVARAVVAAVRPHLAAEFRAELFQQAAELPGADMDDPGAETRARVLDGVVLDLERLAAKLRRDGHPVRAIGADYAAELLRGQTTDD